MGDSVVFLEPGDERAQKIAKAMGSQTASDILQLLSEGPKSLSDITEKLNLPMNTAKYHVENLLDAGLIGVETTKYSVKGREVKIYTLTNQLLVVAPRQADARSLLLKYASLFGIVALGTILISALTPLFSPQSMMRASVNTMNAAPPSSYAVQGGEAGAVAKAVSETVATNVTHAAGVLTTGAKGAADSWAANVSALTTAAPSAPVPVPTAVPTTLMQAVPETPAEYITAGLGSAVPAVDPALAFFLGGVLVIVVLVCYEAWLWKKHRN